MTITTTDELRAAMHDLGIVVEITAGPTLTATDGWDHNAYRWSLTIRGEQLMSNATYSAGTGLPVPADPADVFGSLISDLQSVEPYAVSDEEEERSVMAQERASWPPGWDEWADDLALVTNARSARKAADDFREIMARRWLIRDRLGADAYARIISAEL